MALPKLPSESSGLEDQGPVSSTDSVLEVVHRDSCLDPAGGCAEEGPALSPGSPTHQPEVAQQSELKRTGQVTPSEQSPAADERLPMPPGQATQSGQSPKKAV